mgnify:CR=1 FL=1
MVPDFARTIAPSTAAAPSRPRASARCDAPTPKLRRSPGGLAPPLGRTGEQGVRRDSRGRDVKGRAQLYTRRRLFVEQTSVAAGTPPSPVLGL